MPITEDILDHDWFGPLIRESIEKGRVEGEQIGEQRGEQRGERKILTKQIAKRFGPLPDWAHAHLESLGTAELEALSLRLLDAPTLQDLLS